MIIVIPVIIHGDLTVQTNVSLVFVDPTTTIPIQTDGCVTILGGTAEINITAYSPIRNGQSLTLLQSSSSCLTGNFTGVNVHIQNQQYEPCSYTVATPNYSTSQFSLLFTVQPIQSTECSPSGSTPLATVRSLSNASIAGIAVGAAVFLAIVITVIVFLVQRSRVRAEQKRLASLAKNHNL